MRCQYCGSKTIHPDTQHKNFSAGKAVAGAVVFGPVGTVAGVIGKDIKGYRCGSCGAFSEATMSFSTETAIDSAIKNAKEGKETGVYEYYKSQYPSIETITINRQIEKPSAVSVISQSESVVSQQKNMENNIEVKNLIQLLEWDPACPVYIKDVAVITKDNADYVLFRGINQNNGCVRSIYIDVTVMDDTGDEIGTTKCVFQGINLDYGQPLPYTLFDLNTNIAYKVSVTIEKIALENGDVWRHNNESLILIDSPVKFDTGLSLYKYFEEEAKKIAALEEDSGLYIPISHDDYWQCICGTPVKRNCSCPSCNAGFDELKKISNLNYLREIQLSAVKERAQKRAEKTVPMFNSHIEKNYARAVQLSKMNKSELLEESIALFTELGDYKDSREKLKESGEKLSAKKLQEQKDQIRAEKEAEEKRIADEERLKRLRLLSEERTRKKEKQLLFAIIFFVIASCIVLLYCIVISPSIRYRKILNAFNNPSESRIVRMGEEMVVTFGSYNNIPIDWIVIETDGDYVLLISKNVLDEIPYRESTEWLRDFENSFADEEKSILDTILVHYESQVPDYFFLVSRFDVLGSMNEKQCCSTYNGQGASWWIRYNAAYPWHDLYYCVSPTGEIIGTDENSQVGIRPAMWISIDS